MDTAISTLWRDCGFNWIWVFCGCESYSKSISMGSIDVEWWSSSTSMGSTSSIRLEHRLSRLFDTKLLRLNRRADDLALIALIVSLYYIYSLYKISKGLLRLNKLLWIFLCTIYIVCIKIPGVYCSGDKLEFSAQYFFVLYIVCIKIQILLRPQLEASR